MNQIRANKIKEFLTSSIPLDERLEKAKKIFFLTSKTPPQLKEDVVLSWLCNYVIYSMEQKAYREDLGRILCTLATLLESRHLNALFSNDFHVSLSLEFVDALINSITSKEVSPLVKQYGYQNALVLFKYKAFSLQKAKFMQSAASVALSITKVLSRNNLSYESLSLLEAISSQDHHTAVCLKNDFQDCINSKILHPLMRLCCDVEHVPETIKEKLSNIQTLLLKAVIKDRIEYLIKDLDMSLKKSNTVEKDLQYVCFLQQCIQDQHLGNNFVLEKYFEYIQLFYPKNHMLYYKLAFVTIKLNTTTASNGNKKVFINLGVVKTCLEFLASVNIDLAITVLDKTSKKWLVEIGKSMLDAETLSEELIEILQIILRMVPSFCETEQLLEKVIAFQCKSHSTSQIYSKFMYDLASIYARRQQISELLSAITNALNKNEAIIPLQALPFPNCAVQECPILPFSFVEFLKEKIQVFGVKMLIDFWSSMTQILTKSCVQQLEKQGGKSIGTVNSVALIIWLISSCLSSAAPQSLYTNAWSVKEITKNLTMFANMSIGPLFDKIQQKSPNDNLCGALLFLINIWAELEMNLLINCSKLREGAQAHIRKSADVDGLYDFSMQFPSIKSAQWKQFNDQCDLTKMPSTRRARCGLIIQKFLWVLRILDHFKYNVQSGDMAQEPPKKKRKVEPSQTDDSTSKIVEKLEQTRMECENWFIETLGNHKDEISRPESALLLHYLPLAVTSFNIQNFTSIAPSIWAGLVNNEDLWQPFVKTTSFKENATLLHAMKRTLCQEIMTLAKKKPQNLKMDTAEAMLSEISIESTSPLSHRNKLKKLTAYLKGEKATPGFNPIENVDLCKKFNLLKTYYPLSRLPLDLAADLIVMSFVLLKEDTLSVSTELDQTLVFILTKLLRSREIEMMCRSFDSYAALEAMVKGSLRVTKQFDSDENTLLLALGNTYSMDLNSSANITSLLKATTQVSVQMQNMDGHLSSYLLHLVQTFQNKTESTLVTVSTLLLLSELLKQEKIHSNTDSTVRENLTTLSVSILSRSKDCVQESDNCVFSILFVAAHMTLFALHGSQGSSVNKIGKKVKKENKLIVKEQDQKNILKGLTENSIKLALQLANQRLQSKNLEIRAFSQQFLVQAVLRWPELWKEVPINDVLANLDHSLATKVFSAFSSTEYEEFLKSQFEVMKGVNTSTEMSKSLNMWDPIVKRESSLVKKEKLQDNVQKLFGLILAQRTNDATITCHILKFFKNSFQSLKLSHYSRSLSMNLIASIPLDNYTDEQYFEVVKDAIELTSAYVSADTSVHHSLLPALMGVISTLIRDIINRSNYTLDLSTDTLHMYEQLCDKVERLVVVVTKRYNDQLSDLGHLTVADIIIWLQTNPPCPTIRNKIERLVFHLMKKLSSNEIKYLMNSMKPSAVSLLRSLLSTFSKTIMFDNFRREA